MSRPRLLVSLARSPVGFASRRCPSRHRVPCLYHPLTLHPPLSFTSRSSFVSAPVTYPVSRTYNQRRRGWQYPSRREEKNVYLKEVSILSVVGVGLFVTPTVLLWAVMTASIVGVAGADYQCAEGGDLAQLLWCVVHVSSVIRVECYRLIHTP